MIHGVSLIGVYEKEMLVYSELDFLKSILRKPSTSTWTSLMLPLCGWI